ncbi:hypothetical protein PILCRDRAFT_813425 [Piloderma croceum F 1598]|uniref:Uncharacterized protein n=1 Tax=Piloderma croceum (strain F 1598) TaxID=765440 RepID=A0A0C3GCR1_PILCF|nr:hypothetical protein PILCRDRAFT_813425 [Piloderma croceum F 1598]
MDDSHLWWEETGSLVSPSFNSTRQVLQPSDDAQKEAVSLYLANLVTALTQTHFTS